MRTRPTHDDRFTACERCKQIIPGDTEMRVIRALMSHMLNEHGEVTVVGDEITVTSIVTHQIVNLT